jgi:Peptidogalycan biosysnthesis/recognition
MDDWPTYSGTVEICTRDGVSRNPRWSRAFATERKDHRYYEIIEDTIKEDFDYGYFVIKDGAATVRAVQPFFVLDQDLLVGASPRYGALIERLRRVFPRFMRLRTLMVGCAAGEGHLDADDSSTRDFVAQALACGIVQRARSLNTRLIILKEFPARYRACLDCFRERGFARLPSMPMTRLTLNYADFDDYMRGALNSATRTKLRKKFRAAAAASIELEVVTDVTSIIDDVYPLYMSVYERSKLHFEKLTKEYFCELGRLMPDKVRFFVWRQNGRILAFAACMLQADAFYAENIGLDYGYAFELHLYHYAYRDMVSWAIDHGYQEFRSGSLNYDPKLHFRHALDPIDLYVRHTSTPVNAALKFLLPALDPTRYDKTLKKFANFDQLRGH